MLTAKKKFSVEMFAVSGNAHHPLTLFYYFILIRLNTYLYM